MQDSILFWNAVALEAVRVSHSDPDKRQQNGPTLSSRAVGIVHLAMYDAFAALTGLPRYINPAPPAPAGLARDAVAGAAYRTLSALYSAQIDFFNAQLSCFDTSSPAFQHGSLLGVILLNQRANDMDARSCGYMPSMSRGRHRVDPDNPGQGFHAPFYGAQMRTFAVSARHALAVPPFANGLDSKYLAALRDVRARGIRPDLMATLPTALFAKRRTPLDTLIGIYWAYDGANRLGTPVRLYNQIIRQVAVQKNNNESQNARLFGFVNAALADAGILAWQQKYCHDFWRPVVGIREHDRTMGPQAPFNVNTNFNDGDPGWLPLGAPNTNSPGMKNFTPDFPAYPSGHATFGAAAFHITRMFYNIPANNKSNDNLFLGSFVSDEFNGGNRDNEGTVRPRHARPFPGGLWQMIMENALSRVHLGVHWIFDAFDFTQSTGGDLVPSLANENIGGVGLGLRIARDIWAFGGNGAGPKMTPSNAAVPPIITPAAASPMPARPALPASVGGCANTIIPPFDPDDVSDTEKKGGTKKPPTKPAKKKGRGQAAEEARSAAAGEPQEAWPTGISEQDEGSPSAHGAWPSGISER